MRSALRLISWLRLRPARRRARCHRPRPPRLRRRASRASAPCLPGSAAPCSAFGRQLDSATAPDSIRRRRCRRRRGCACANWGPLGGGPLRLPLRVLALRVLTSRLAAAEREDLLRRPGLAQVLDLLGGEAGAYPLVTGQRALGGARDVERVVEVVRRGVGLRRVGERQLQRLVDHPPARQVVPVDERDGDAGLAARPVRPMRCR